MPAAMKVLVLDACQTARLGQSRGVRAGPSFEIGVVRPAVEGLVVIRSTRSGEPAHESDALQGAVFAHYLVSSLRGAGDADQDGRVTLLGDACHPMLPFMAQGAAQSIEDGATLATLLATMPDDLRGALKRYEEIRKPRATRLQEASAANRSRFHLPDGPEQRKRDEAMATSGDRSIANIGWLYAHDAAAAS